MRESNYSETNSIQFSDHSSNRNDFEDSVVFQKQKQIVPKKEDEEINLSTINYSSISVDQSKNNSKIINKENKSQIKESNLDLTKQKSLGNKLNFEIMKEAKDNKLYLKVNKEQSEKNGYTVYEIKHKTKILCYRRYDNFRKFYEVLKIRYPHYIIPKLSPKAIMAKVYDDQIFIEQRRKELEFFINEIAKNKDIGKGEEIKIFLRSDKFDKDYFNSLLKFFDYPETLKKIDESKGIITKGVKSVSNLYNYLIGNQNQIENEREESKKIFEKVKNLDQKLEKYQSIYNEVKNIYNIMKDENTEKKHLVNNFLFLKNEGDVENNKDKKKFNELVDLHQNYDFKKEDSFIVDFEERIIYPLNFSIFYLIGEKKAINRYQLFLEQYNEIINFKNIDNENKRIALEQQKIKTDINKYEEILLKEIDKIEERTKKDYENIMNILLIRLKDSTQEFVDLYKNSNFLKD